MTLKINWLFIALLITGITIYPAKAQKSVTRNVTQTLLSGIAMSEMVNNTYSISADLRRIAFCIRKGDKMIAVVDTFHGKAYDEVNIPVFSRDGKRFAYSARNGNNWILVVDNVQKVVLDPGTVITFVLFSPDSKNIIYVFKKAQKYFIVVDGKKSLPYDHIDENSISFNVNSKIAFTAGLDKKQFIVFNDIKGASYDQVGFPVFSPDGKRLAYWAVIGKQYFVVLNNKKSKPYEAIGSIFFSRDGKQFLYDAKLDGKQLVFVNGKASEPYESVHSVTLSPDGKRLAYAVTLPPEGEEEFHAYVVIDGKKEGPYEQVMPELEFSADSKGFAYGTQLPISVIKNGVEVELADMEWFIMHNGKEGKRYNMLQGYPVFSPNGRHLAYAGEENSKRIISVDGIEDIPYDDVFSIVFSPDSERLAYSVKLDNKEWVVLNGNKGRVYDDLLAEGQVIFDSNNSFHYIARSGNNIYLVEEKVD